MLLLLVVVCKLKINKYNFTVGHPTEMFFMHCFQVELQFERVVFVEGEKLKNQRKPPGARGEPTTN